MSPADYTATLRRRFLPLRGHFAHFHDRHAMRRGHPERSFQLALPIPTLPIDWTKSGTLLFPMNGNGRLGDCMEAMAAHADNAMTGNAGSESSFDEKALESQYLRASGGDNGLDEGTLLSQCWQPGLAGVKEATYYDALDVDPTDVKLMQAAMALFGNVCFMLDVPAAWIRNFDTGCLWDAPARADQNNGHGVFLSGVDAQGRYRVQTWGTYCWLTQAGVGVCDASAFVVFSPRWFNAQGIAPNGLTYDQLAQYWVEAGGKPLPPSPFVNTPPAPVPTPPAPPPPVPTPTPGPLPVNIEQLVQKLIDDAFAAVEASQSNRPLLVAVLKELQPLVDAELQKLLGGSK